MKKNTISFNSFILVFIFFSFFNAKAQDTPFNCVYDAYLFQYNDVFSIDLASGNSFLVATDLTEGNLNAAAYNSADGFIWASTGTPAKTIIRIGNDFTTTSFNIPELSTNSCYIGDINLNGIYYLKSGGTTYNKIDLNPDSSTYTKHIGTYNLSKNISIHDWAFNAVDNNLYAVEKNTNILYRINPENGEVQSIVEVPILSGFNYTYGAVYFDVSGRFYVSSNQTGTIYAIQNVQDLNGTNTISSNLFAFGPSSASNDGARCSTAPVPQEICDNGIDDDGDGLIDCEDASCSNVGNCEIIATPTSGGNEGGLESNNRLSEKINKRNYNRTKNNYKFNRKSAKKVKKAIGYAKKSNGTIQLQNFIPLNIISETSVIESTPNDLLDITNATEVFAVDYMNDEISKASILALKTENGVYEHTKYICDRLLGAELLSVSTIEINEQSFIKSMIKNTDETIEFVLSFSAKQVNDTFEIESHWNLDKYEENKTFYNFQIWSNSIDDLHKLGSEVLNLLNIEKTISLYNNSTPPTVFVKKGKYNSGHLSLEIVNTNNTKEVTLDAGIRSTETSNINNVSTKINLESYINTINVETDNLFDIGFRVGDGFATPDDLFMSDGSWGIDDASAGTTITEYEVYQNETDYDADDFPIERNIHLEASINDYVAVYRSLTPRFKAVNMTDYNTFSLKTKGTGNLEVIFIKKSISDWEKQNKIIIPLTETLQEHKISFTDFKNDFGDSDSFNDLVTIVFKTTSETGETITKSIYIEDVAFTSSKSLATDTFSSKENKIIATPNPMQTSSTINFYANNSEKVEFTVYNQLGQLVYVTSLQTKIGENKILLSKAILSKNIYFCKIKSNQAEYGTLKLIVQ